MKSQTHKKKPQKKSKPTSPNAKHEDVFVRATPTTAAQIQALAKQIWTTHMSACKKAGYNRPTAKMALDYMLAGISETCGYKTEIQTTANNIFLRIAYSELEE
ncbi:TPA_asm: hypothetical protein vir530_00018 [dsDNA virus vir530]|nr:TPA_asm: hypothetical protein vir530_00018 [dsDNA virus vir530]